MCVCTILHPVARSIQLDSQYFSSQCTQWAVKVIPLPMTILHLYGSVCKCACGLSRCIILHNQYSILQSNKLRILLVSAQDILVAPDANSCQQCQKIIKNRKEIILLIVTPVRPTWTCTSFYISGVYTSMYKVTVWILHAATTILNTAQRGWFKIKYTQKMDSCVNIAGPTFFGYIRARQSGFSSQWTR